MTIAEYFYAEGFKEGFEKSFKEGFEKGFKESFKKVMKKKGRKRGLDEDRIATLCSQLVFQSQTFAAEYEACLQEATSEAIERRRKLANAPSRGRRPTLPGRPCQG